jgi:hypothetical protein
MVHRGTIIIPGAAGACEPIIPAAPGIGMPGTGMPGIAMPERSIIFAVAILVPPHSRSHPVVSRPRGRNGATVTISTKDFK